MSTRGRPILYKAENGFFAHLQPTTSVSATKVFPGGLRPPAIAKSLAEIAGIAEMGAAVHPWSAPFGWDSKTPGRFIPLFVPGLGSRGGSDVGGAAIR
jgi:hypothetical protein